MRKQHDLSNFA